MKLSRMSIKKSIMAFAAAGMFAGTIACNAPTGNEGQEADPGATDEMYEEPMPAEESMPADTTSAVDTTAADTLDSGF